MTNYTRKSLHGVVFIFAFTLLAHLFGYLIRILYANQLTTAEYGLVYSIFALFGLFSLLQNLGLNEAMVTLITRFRVKKQLKEVVNISFTVILLQLVTSLLLGGVFIVISNLLGTYYFKSDLAAPLIILYAISVVLSPLEAWCQSLFQSLQKMFLFGLTQFLRPFMIFLFSLLFFSQQLGIASVFYAYLAIYLLTFLFYLPLLYRYLVYKQIPHKDISFSTNHIKELFFLGVPLAITGIAGIIMTYMDTFFITYFRTLTEVGLYNAAVPTASILWSISGILYAVILPISSELHAKKESNMIRQGIELLYRYTTIVVLPVILVFFFFSDTILGLLFGQEYAAQTTFINAPLVLQILAIGSFFIAFAKINFSFFVSFGKPGIPTKIYVIGAVVNLIGNLLLIPHYGMIGAAVMTSTSFVIMFIISIILLNKEVTLELTPSFWFKILFAVFIPGTAIYVLKQYFIFNPWIGLILYGIIAGSLYFLSLLLFKVITLKEIKHLIKQIT